MKRTIMFLPVIFFLFCIVTPSYAQFVNGYYTCKVQGQAAGDNKTGKNTCVAVSHCDSGFQPDTFCSTRTLDQCDQAEKAGKKFGCAAVSNNSNNDNGESTTTGDSVVSLNSLLNDLGSQQKNPIFTFSGSTTLGQILSAALPFIYGLTGIVLLVFMIRAGFLFLTSAGDAKKLESAKGALTAAIIGFIIIFVAFWLTQIVNYVFHLGSGV